MINRKTCIVVGAGASADVGFPLGVKLKAEVAEILSGRDPSTKDWFLGCVALQNGNQRRAAEDVLARCARYRDQIIGAASVDNFLDQRRNDQEMVLAAKAAIYFAISRAEQSCVIGRKLRGQAIQSAAPDYFINPLMNFVSRGHTREDILESLRNLTFVTFNYDRAIERSVVIWLKENFHIDSSETLKFLDVKHVYGSLGTYDPLEAGNYFDFQGQFPMSNPHIEIAKFAGRISLFTEQTNAKIRSEIIDALRGAKTVFYLGFGFEEQNTRLLKCGSNSAIFATTYGMGAANSDSVQRIIGVNHGIIKPNIENFITLFDGKAKALFQEHYFDIASAIGSI